MSRRLGVVVNPERTEIADDVIARLRSAGCDVVVAAIDAAEELASAASHMIEQGVDAVVAVGGDGTQRAVATVLAGTGVPLAVVPGGTVNLLARVIGIDDIDLAIDAAVDLETRIIDLGDADGEAFVLNATSGWDAAVIRQADDGVKRFGRFGFATAGLREWFRTRPVGVEIEIDGRQIFRDDVVSVMVLNVGQRASASIELAPDAAIDDGRLDVVVLRRHSLRSLARASVAAMRSREAPVGDVATFQGAEIAVRWDTAVETQIDGDGAGRSAALRYTVRPVALSLCVPPTGARS